jgi:ABC-type uncharacterized transport system substrate-binding protein
MMTFVLTILPGVIVMKKHYLLLKFVKVAFLSTVFCLKLDAIGLPLSEALSHPHVFIVQRLNVVFDDKGLAGIKVRWKFDDMFASMIAEDHDLNRNGKFETNEIKAVKEKAFSFISKYNYFIFIKIDNTPFQVKFIRDFNAILENKKLVYEFLIPCHVTATNHFKKITVATYDPTYYTAIYFTQKKPVSLTAADAFEVKATIRQDPDTKIYFDMVHPWTLFTEFRKK